MNKLDGNFEVTITPGRFNFLKLLSEVWRYRELLYIFAWRDVKVRYKQTLLGVAWAVFQPLVSTVIFTIFFGNLAKIPSGNMPYSLFILSGMVFWTFFSNSLTHASESMVNNEGIIKKVYFPKIILPFSSIFISGIDFSINFIILLVFALFLGFVPSIWIFVVVPLAILAIAITVIGAGLLFASVNVKYRDVRYVLPFFIQTLMFITPVIYPLNIVAPQKRYFMALNPMTSVIESVRLVFSGGGFLDPWLILISVLSMFTILIVGIWYFRKTERFFADIV